MASRSFKRLVEQKFGKVGFFFVYAILEWIMIIILFIDGFLAFFTNEFAKFFELKVPCLLCSRIDHIFIKRNCSFYYNDSICEVHKKDISSLAYCHVHKKLSDIRNMCEGCLLSFATEKDADCDRYKSLVGILHKDIECFVDNDWRISLKSVKEDAVTQDGSVVALRCTCCGEPLKLRTKYSRNSSINGNIYAQAPAPSPRSPLTTWRNEETRNLELPHIQYTELKFASDNDSDLPDDEGHQNTAGREDIKAATDPQLPDPEDIHVESSKTPNFTRNKLFGIPLSESAQASPRWTLRHRKLSAGKTELISDANDTSAANEADDDFLHRLKRQVRLDRNSLMALYMELDEERSASAVAANNAMAMITRLQADKAAVQMEALQYQRMMEEQAEYDQEALQVMKDLVLKREEEVKVLEAELDTYREKYGDIKRVGSEVCEDADDDYQELKSHSASSFGEKSDCGSPRDVLQNGVNEFHIERPGEYREGMVDASDLDFDRERSYLLGLLTNLEKKIKMPPDVESHVLESEVIQDRGNENKTTLTTEMSLIRERLRSIEAESGFLKHAAITLQRGGGGTKLLAEIAQHLRELRYCDKAKGDADA